MFQFPPALSLASSNFSSRKWTLTPGSPMSFRKLWRMNGNSRMSKSRLQISCSRQKYRPLSPSGKKWVRTTFKNLVGSGYQKCRTWRRRSKKIITVLGMQPCEKTGTVPEDARSHLLVLSGIFCGGFKVLVRAQVSMPTSGCILKAMVRSDNADVAKMVIEFLGE